MGKNVIILNGPPDSGKDRAAEYLCQKINQTANLPTAYHNRFKDKLFELTTSIFNIDEETFFGLYDNRKTKEVPTPLLYDKSPRGSLIFVSETMIKPNFDKEYFGRCANQNLKDGINVFSDGGFVDEINPIYENVGKDNLLIVRLHRPGRDFSKDSRDYIKSYKDVKIIDIHNNACVDAFETKLQCEILNKIKDHLDV